MLKQKTILFASGFVQVFFVAVNTFFIAKEQYILVFPTSLIISLIWSSNIKKLAFGSMSDRIVYSIGAAIGSVIGLLISKSIQAWSF